MNTTKPGTRTPPGEPNDALSDHHDLELAARIHYSFMTREFASSHVDVAVTVQPFDRIGGDYCSIIPLEGNRLLIGICDVVGHSVASALLAARINTYVTTHGPGLDDPCVLVHRLNEYLSSGLDDLGIYSTFAALYLNFNNMTAAYSAAAHPPLLHFSDNDPDIREYRSDTSLVGIEHPLPLQCGTRSFALESGDKLVLYTDGITEARNRDGHELGIEGLKERIAPLRDRSPDEINRVVTEAIVETGPYTPMDDILNIVISIK